MRFGDYKQYRQDLESGKIIQPTFTDLPLRGTSSRLGENISYGRSRYHLVVGTAGSGKTSFVDTNFVLKPYLNWLYHGGPKPFFIYRSMERSSLFKEVKWKAALLYYLDNYIIDVPTILGLSNKKRDLTQKDKDMLDKYDKLLADMESNSLDIKDGSRSPEEILEYATKIAHQKGHLVIADDKVVRLNDKVIHEFVTYEEKSGVKFYYWDSKLGRIRANSTTYFPSDDTVINHITDHIGKVKGGNTKSGIDDHSANMADILRDTYLMQAIDIMQLNRDIFDTGRMKTTKLTIKMSDLKGSGVPPDNADTVMGILDPAMFDHSKYEGFNVAEMSKYGPARFRALIVPKNSWGIANFFLPLYFMGESGWTTELPKNPSDVNYEQTAKGIWRP